MIKGRFHRASVMAALTGALASNGGQAGRSLKSDMPLVPAASIAGRALVTVVAIMTFLAALTAGMAILISDASSDWQSDVSREMTIQIRPTPGRDIDADTLALTALARNTAGIAAAEPYSKAESEKLLQPWLGTGLDLSDLPVPRLIVVKLGDVKALDVSSLRKSVEDAVPGASLDDHRLWLARLASMAHATVAIGFVVFVLVLAAMMLAVAFATLGAMAGNREIIEVLHFVGAADSFISSEFQQHFFRLGLRGGGIGGLSAILFFAVMGQAVGWWRATPGGEQIEALFGTFSLHAKGYAAIIVIAAAIAVITGFVSRIIVFRHLRRLN
ncbi:MAG: ABC transporter permease [Beijerinckiaceae bacterium]|jgi:cell division transport system permease protein